MEENNKQPNAIKSYARVFALSVATIVLAGVMSLERPGREKIKPVRVAEKSQQAPRKTTRTTFPLTHQQRGMQSLVGSSTLPGNVSVRLEPTGTIYVDQGEITDFDVNVYVRAEDTDIYNVITFQFDVSQATGAEVVGVTWNQDVLGDVTTGACGFDGAGGVPDCRYNVFSYDGIINAQYQWETYNPNDLVFDGDHPPVQLLLQSSPDPLQNGDVFIAVVHMRHDGSTTPGHFDVCGEPHVLSQTGVSFDSIGTALGFDYDSTLGTYSESHGNISGCSQDPLADNAPAHLTIVPQEGTPPEPPPPPPAPIEIDFQPGGQFSYPPNGAIDARDGRTGQLGFNKMCLRFTDAVSTTNLVVSDFQTFQFIGTGMPVGDIASVNYSIVPQVTNITFNAQDADIENVPGANGSNVACLTLSPALRPATWLIIKHVPSNTKAWLGYLPGDVDTNGKVQCSDQHYYIQNGNPSNPPGTLAVWQDDINRDGSYTSNQSYHLDKNTLKMVRQYNGNSNRWQGAQLPDINGLLAGIP